MIEPVYVTRQTQDAIDFLDANSGRIYRAECVRLKRDTSEAGEHWRIDLWLLPKRDDDGS